MAKQCFKFIHRGMLAYQTAALALADPEQGESTDFLKAAQQWRSLLPNDYTSQLLMVHEFINELKSNDTQRRLLPAYELVTQLINSTQSYRYWFNSYYAAYQQSIVPHNTIYLAALRQQDWPWSMPQATMRVLWSPAPAGLDGCVIKNAVLQANNDCIDASTPVLGNLQIKALLISTVGKWSAYEFSCSTFNSGRLVLTGCIDHSGHHFKPGPMCRKVASMPLVFAELRSFCASSLNSATQVVAYNYVNFSGEPEYYPVTKFTSASSFTEHTCKGIDLRANQSIVI